MPGRSWLRHSTTGHPVPPETPAMLADAQARIVTVIQQGPKAFPQGLFSGPDARALLGLKAHANTISHARLVALEDSFPRTRERIGHQRFNALSRQFIELPDARIRKLMRLGEAFPAFLASQGCDAQSCELAQIEWAWLESYHAADAPALMLGDLATLDEAALLAMPIALHPACRWVHVSAPIADQLPELGTREPADCPTVLITRPEADVLLHPLDKDKAVGFEILLGAGQMCNLLGSAIERLDEARALPVIFALIGAGALARPSV